MDLAVESVREVIFPAVIRRELGNPCKPGPSPSDARNSRGAGFRRCSLQSSATRPCLTRCNGSFRKPMVLR